MACAGSDPGRDDFRHHAGHDFPLAPGPAALRHSRERPRSSPAFNLGFGHRGAVLTLYLLGAMGGGASVLVSYLSARMSSLVGAIDVCTIFAGVVYLERAPYERQTGKTSPAP